MLRRFLPVLAAALLFAACDRGPTESAPIDEPSFEAVLETAGEGEAAAMLLERAPESLRLTDAQKAAIRELNQAFRVANRADYEALRAITREAMQARRNGATPDEVRAILERSRPVRERLAAAFRELHAKIAAVLTDAQRAWLREHNRRLGPGLPQLPQLPPGPPRRP
jgi:Spy/CpxP family protein refolding chaperone